MWFLTRNSKRKFGNNISLAALDYYIDEEMKKEYAEQGFVIQKGFLSDGIIEKLLLLTKVFIDQIEVDFAYSTMLCDSEENIEIHRKTSLLLRSEQERLFKNFKACSATFLIKPAKSYHEMDLHQDWSFTDETRFVPSTFWVPLQDVKEENGAFFLIPKSHRLFKNKRSNSLPTARIPREEMNEHVQTICLEKGDLLLFNPAVFHGSHSNSTDRHRIAFTMTILPEEAPLIYYEKWNEKEAKKLYLEQHAYLTQMKDFNETHTFFGELGNTLSYKHHIPSAKDLKSFLQNL